VDPRKISAHVDSELRQKLPNCQLIDATSILVKLRRIKSPAEIEVIRMLANAASQGMEAALAAAVPGNSEHDVAAEFYYSAFKNGCDLSPLGMRVQSGTRSAMKNVLPKRGKIILDGEIVSIDTSADLCGYWSDHARSTIAGKGSAEQIRLLEACVEAQEAGLAVAGPGVPIPAVVIAMEDVVRKYGFEEWDWSTGHGFGLDLVEDPIIVRDSPALLEAGQTFFIEPMIVPTHMGTSCFEDTVLITENGAERLTSSPMRTW
jgi:Xaa-Pro dipeptidase